MKSFKTRLDPNNKQRTAFAKHAGTARHAWNWGLSVCKEAYEQKVKRPTAIDLHKRLVAEVKSVNDWYYEFSKCTPQEALRQLDKAYKHAFTRKGRAIPKFKKKGRKDSFYLEGSIKISGDKIKLPKIGWVKCHEILPACTPKNVSISLRAGQWYIAFKIDVTPKATEKQLGIIGVDVGIKTLATLSNGQTFANPKAYSRHKKALKRLQIKLSRQQKGSNNRQKTKAKLASKHKRVANIRLDATHKLTSYLAKNHSRIVIEDLNVSGLLKNHKLAGAIADAGFSEFKRQLQYKCEWYDSELMIVNRFYPSSKTCSNCGKVKPQLKLSERTFNCGCGFSCDRDLNASINLRHFGLGRQFLHLGKPQDRTASVFRRGESAVRNAASSAVKACGKTKVHGLIQVSLDEAGTKQISTDCVDYRKF